MTIQIERISPRPGGREHPIKDLRGYQLSGPGNGNTVGKATFVQSLKEAADLIDLNFSIRMGCVGKRSSLISAKSLRITRS
ncbi:MAG: hypothetical protein ABSC25_06960 [Roseiarcus sp.]|jgi:hypothetical protein